MATPFISYRENDENGVLSYYILQRAFPHYIGKITTNIFTERLFAQSIPGYNLKVELDGTLGGAIVPGYADIKQELENVLLNMAAWFYSERIISNETRFKKFKVNSNVTSNVG